MAEPDQRTTSPTESSAPQAKPSPQTGHGKSPSPERGKAVTLSPDEYERLLEQAKQGERYLRSLADLENTKKRLQREQEERSRYAAETVVRALLPIMDSLGQALVAIDQQADPPAPASPGFRQPHAGASAQGGPGPAPAGSLGGPGQAIVKGVHLIYRQLLGLLEQEGVKRIPTVGERFDPHRHEAVAQVDTNEDQADGTIVEEVQVGYTMHGKVIRPAMVKVAKRSDQKSEDRGQKTEDRGQKSEDRGQKSENLTSDF